MTEPPVMRRWLCSACDSRLVLEEMCLSGKVPDETTVCDVCGEVGKFKLLKRAVIDPNLVRRP
jgi:hypothetical protein